MNNLIDSVKQLKKINNEKEVSASRTTSPNLELVLMVTILFQAFCFVEVQFCSDERDLKDMITVILFHQQNLAYPIIG